MAMTLDRTVEGALSSMSGIELPGKPSSWALHPDSCRFLASFVRVAGSRRVLEFGSGFSTLIFGRELSSFDGGSILSVDDSRRYSAAAEEAFRAAGSGTRAEFLVSPLRPRFYGPRLLLGYSLPRYFRSRGPFDLALIDAPHHDYGRESVFYDAFGALAVGGYAILDDANREDMEKAYVRVWRKVYGPSINTVHLEKIGNGLCVIQKVRDSAPVYPFAGSAAAAMRTARNFARYIHRSG